MTNETELIRRCQAGATEAFEALVRAHEGPSLGYAAAMLGDVDDAADALQDAFVQAYRAMPRLREGSSFAPWFRTILRNVCLDRLRSPARSRQVTLESAGDDNAVHQAPQGTSAASDALLRRHLEEALRHVPPEQRTVLLLREVEGLSYGEIARLLGIPAGTVASRLNHGRAAMRTLLETRGIGLEDLT